MGDSYALGSVEQNQLILLLPREAQESTQPALDQQRSDRERLSKTQPMVHTDPCLKKAPRR